MFGKLFKKPALNQSALVIARMNDRAQPIDRGELYEDPLIDVLEQHQAGRVTGGGSQLNAEGEIEFCDIEIELNEPASEGLRLVRQTLEKLGAPKGSQLLLDDSGESMPFGQYEGLAVYLNGTDLPDEVYAECDADFVISEFDRLLADDGKVHSFWQGPVETALYVYGPSLETIKSRLADFLNSYPLCQRARLVQIA